MPLAKEAANPAPGLSCVPETHMNAALATSLALSKQAPSLDAIMTRFHMTHRQAEVATLLFWRRTNAEIATALHLTKRTAATYAMTVLFRLGVHSRRDVEAVLSD